MLARARHRGGAHLRPAAGSCWFRGRMGRYHWCSAQIEFCWNWDPGEAHRDAEGRCLSSLWTSGPCYWPTEAAKCVALPSEATQSVRMVVVDRQLAWAAEERDTSKPALDATQIHEAAGINPPGKWRWTTAWNEGHYLSIVEGEMVEDDAHVWILSMSMSMSMVMVMMLLAPKQLANRGWREGSRNCGSALALAFATYGHTILSMTITSSHLTVLDTTY